jgi:hypothetical protein
MLGIEATAFLFLIKVPADPEYSAQKLNKLLHRVDIFLPRVCCNEIVLMFILRLFRNIKRRDRELTLLLRIREVTGSNFGPETGYPD